MLDVVEVIADQLFDKLLTIPYSIRQFCKCLYQSVKDKFGCTPNEENLDLDLIRLVSHFLLEKWILKSLFEDLDMEGLIKNFN